MKKWQLVLLSLLSGLLFTLSWPERGLFLFIFTGFIPLLFIEDHLCSESGRYSTWHALFFSYPSFFTWNLLSTWWIWNATAFGMIMAVLFNSLFMSLVFTLYHWTKKRFFGYGRGYFILVFYWISFEFLHMRWDLTWSWLNIGNVFATVPSLVQWYEYTGIFGGAIWIFMLNICFYKIIHNLSSGTASKHKLLLPGSLALLILILPSAFSLIIFNNYTEKADPLKVVVVQPNIDPYQEQYELPLQESFDRVFRLAAQKVDSSTDLLVAPESVLQENIWENRIDQSNTYQWLMEYLKLHPRLNLIIGASTFYRYGAGEKPSETARFSKREQFHYDAYNTAIFLDSSGRTTLYHKSKLVAGVERMPFPRYLKFLENYAIDLGGTIGSLGLSTERSVHLLNDGRRHVAAAICYESVYGAFFAEFTKNGAEVMCIITNDGWWGNTPGHRQHLSFAPLRAIETRRCIARAANTGISCFVDQRGMISQPTAYWEPAVISAAINANDKVTFYARHGDYLARVSLILAGIMILAGFFVKKKKLL